MKRPVCEKGASLIEVIRYLKTPITKTYINKYLLGFLNTVLPPVAVSLCRWLCRVQVGSSLPTCTRHSHRHRVTATRGCIGTICLSWWWARCARNILRVKNINKYIEKNCASRWSFTKNHWNVSACIIFFPKNPFSEDWCFLNSKSDGYKREERKFWTRSGQTFPEYWCISALL